MAEKRTAYLGDELVRRHIADAAYAWDSALASNNGGIGRLAGALGPVCDPALKAGQVSARVEELAGAMAERLRPLWRSSDRTAELAQAKKRATEVVRSLVDCARAQMFGPLLRAMQITQEQVAGVHWRMQTEPEDNLAPVGIIAAETEYVNELADLLGESSAAAYAGRLDYFERLAGMVIGAWDETLQAFAADTAFLAAAKLPPEHAALMAGQIAAAARRTDLRGCLAATLRERAGFHGRAATGAGKFVRIAEDMVNGFVTYLGFDRMEEARRPAVGAAGPGQRRIFAARPAVTGLPPLTEQPSPYDRAFHVDWMTAFVRMAEDNVVDQSAEPFDRAANDALGRSSNDSMTVHSEHRHDSGDRDRGDPSQPPGYALVRIPGRAASGLADPRFRLTRDGYEAGTLGPGGWQVADTLLAPLSARGGRGRTCCSRSDLPSWTGWSLALSVLAVPAAQSPTRYSGLTCRSRAADT